FSWIVRDSVVTQLSPRTAELQPIDKCDALHERFFRQHPACRETREETPACIFRKNVGGIIPPYHFQQILLREAVVDPTKVVETGRLEYFILVISGVGTLVLGTGEQLSDCRRDKSISERLEVIAPQLLLFNTNHKSNAMRTEIPGVVHIGVRRATGSTLQRLRQLWRAASARALDQHRLSVGVIRFIIPCIQVPRCAEPFDRTEALVKRGVKNYLQTFYPRHIDRTSEVALENVVVVFHVTCRVCTHDSGVYAVLDVGSRQS